MNKVNRRRFLGLAVAALGGTALAACQPQVVEKVVQQTVEVKETVQVKETVVVEKTVKEPVTIEAWGLTGLVNEETLKKFQEQFPYITVNPSELGEAVFGDQKFTTAVAAGKGPTVAVQNRHTFMQFAAKGLYLDVSPYFEKSGLKASDYLPVQFEETSWQGKPYGLPIATDTRYLFWNKKHFEEAGLDPTKPPATWAELEAFTDKLTKKDSKGNVERYGFVPYLFGNSWMWLWGFINKAPAISQDKRTILCDDPKWVETLQWLVDFYDKHVGSFELANAFSEGVTASGLGDPFVAEKVSMTAHGDWFVGDLLRSPGVEWDCAPAPISPSGEKSTWSCGWSLVIPPSAKYPDAGWELLKWWTGVEGWQAYAEASKADTARVWAREQITGDPKFWPTDACYLPALKMLEEQYVSQLGDVEKKAWALAMDALENWTHGCGTEMGLAALEYWVEMDNAARDALAHKKTPKQAMDDCKKKVQEATDRAWEAVDAKK